MQIPALALFAGYDGADVRIYVDAVHDARAVLAEGGQQIVGRDSIGDSGFEYVSRPPVSRQRVEHRCRANTRSEVSRVRQRTGIRNSTFQFRMKRDHFPFGLGYKFWWDAEEPA
jgi:hypothetical protein